MQRSEINDYGVIGDAGSIALISRGASIDWLCWPYYHSPSLFGRLLDPQAGSCHLRPVERAVATSRRYLPDTAILQTTFGTARGEVTVTDAMVARGEETNDRHLFPNHRLLRKVECTRGEVEVEFYCALRPDYGRIVPCLHHRKSHGYVYSFGSAFVRIHGEVPLSLSEGTLTSRFRLRRGQCRRFSLCYTHEESALLSPLGKHADDEIRWTTEYWRRWVKTCSYEGSYREQIVRSLITLKLLTYSATGAIVAAPTTSLPEEIGGERNWDYRYCWPRDGAFVLRTLNALGYSAEGLAFFNWLMNAAGTKARHLIALYDVFGERPQEEVELTHLEGFNGCRPVRIGNQAAKQFQLDIYGEVLAAASEYVQSGFKLDRWQRSLMLSLGDLILDNWRRADAGIWEKRSPPRRHTHSVVMCWVGLTCLLRMHEEGKLRLKHRSQVENTVDEIRREVETFGYNDELGTYVGVFGETSLDANLLLLSRSGFEDASSPRMRRTFQKIIETLGTGPFLYRYQITDSCEDGLRGKEGAFAMCSFWAIEHLAMTNEFDEAEHRLASLLRAGNDLGLFAEEIDPDSGNALGNFPQAYTHVGLIHSILTLERKRDRQPPSATDHTEEPLAKEVR